ncbi:1-deoxy-D-xylulose-5-phosphate reductoisomerase [Desulfogranum japonicum]|uniref:1-deoxy-D-xylulose-5-phosphate reductoisomerase n=1 Tax=Desulfogranum japonicum TaxID=231447 RepID=UPI0003FA1669|nr:1-deoxy-D-xylulose-5-phosphate reductoisomerase [Desulfogranum japonicum]
MKVISVLGSTGSIGQNVLEIVRRYPERYRIAALTAGSRVELLASQAKEFQPDIISIAREDLADTLRQLLPPGLQERVHVGMEGNVAAATSACAQMVITAVVGSVGLVPTLAAIDAGKDIGLANKETLVMAGRLVMHRVSEMGVRLLPIDSEHSAIFQALEAGRRQDVNTILLTASGGPFRTLPKEDLQGVSPGQALAHPNWNMGQKISIDSATLMNKGLEVIEARWLFDVPPEQIQVVVHPQSIVHSLVEYVDGSVVAQLGIPDMQIPISYALSYPERLQLGLSQLDLVRCNDLTFEDPDFDRFPALPLAFEALQRGGVTPAVLNAANEIAVDAFLHERILFTDIPEIVAAAMAAVTPADDMDLNTILHADQTAREHAQRTIAKLVSDRS